MSFWEQVTYLRKWLQEKPGRECREQDQKREEAQECDFRRGLSLVAGAL